MLMDNRNIEPINKDVIPEPDHDQANNYAQRDIQNKAQSTYPSLRSTGGKELEFLVEKQTKLLNKKLSTIIFLLSIPYVIGSALFLLSVARHYGIKPGINLSSSAEESVNVTKGVLNSN